MKDLHKDVILIVDDNAANLEVLSHFLDEAGFEVAIALDGERALKQVQYCLPDLILLDVLMPGIDGFETCERLKANGTTGEIPIIFMTALSETVDKVRGLKLGAVDYITKPFQQDEVLARVQLHLKLQHLTKTLEQQNHFLKQQTQRLEQSLNFEALLKRITDKVRDSLDEQQILQTAVEELVRGLGICACDTALFNLAQDTLTVTHELLSSCASLRSAVTQLTAFSDTLPQLLQGQAIQFCELTPKLVKADWQPRAILNCPIIDDQSVLGDLWLARSPEAIFSEPEIRLVQQVANQCAIAIRQARLYQAAQTRLAALEHLNQLKDDFLSTVSHELRSPVTNMRMAIQMLEIVFKQIQGDLSRANELQLIPPQANQRITQYLQILTNECDREISLVNDLLDLQRLEAGRQPLVIEPIDLTCWLPSLMNSFQERAQVRHQCLVLQMPDVLPPILADPNALKRVLAELLHNACKYTPPEQRIVIQVDTEPECIRWQVTNYGTEIPVDELPHIFKKFYRVIGTDQWQQGGTGLGLALVKKLVEHMAGTIEASSDRGQTTFTVTIPSVTSS